ncbi:sensor histidine kinase [Streptomyces zaomyceticus]|uniref:sensor histidine kinase n=1 Tax=Streptomyces zaomyceticus TaxID=68286 RepID=UPI0036620F44
MRRTLRAGWPRTARRRGGAGADVRALVLRADKRADKRADVRAEALRADAQADALQVNALQAMCRQVFGFRLAMIALAAPAALLGAAPGLPVRLVGAAVVVTFMGSYVLFRDWERFGPLLLKHPALLAADTLLGALLLVTAGPQSTLGYVSVCTPLLAGLAYSWRGAAFFACLQSLVLLAVRGDVLLLAGLCVITGALGVTLRNLLLRYGEAGRALAEARVRLTAAQAVEVERARLAREMHDSVAGTLHGLALAADALAVCSDPAEVNERAALVARAARRAAAESRELLSDLRSQSYGGAGAAGVDLASELTNRVHDFNTRWEASGIATAYRSEGDGTPPVVPYPMARQLLSIAAEAMENAGRHAHPTRIDVTAGVHAGLLRISVRDDGRGLPPGTTLDTLRGTGHFGLVGMVERAAGVGARLRIGRGDAARGTEVRLEIPLGATR